MSTPPSSSCTIEAFDRRGKVLALHTDGPSLGLHFGMTGRLLRDDVALALDRLEYGSRDDDARWDRWVARPRRRQPAALPRPPAVRAIWLEPDLEVLGPDVLSLTRRQLAAALQGRRAPVKAVLLDQAASPGSATCSSTRCCGGPASTRTARPGR